MTREMDVPGAVDLAPQRPGRLVLRTPFMAAAGCIGYVTEASGSVDLSLMGAAVTRGTTIHPRDGAPPPRMVESPAGLIWSIGHQNPGIDIVLSRHAPRWAHLPLPVIINLWAASPTEATDLAERVDSVPGIAGVELDLAGRDASRAARLAAAARAATDLPLLAKVQATGVDAVAVGRAVADAGADAVTCGGGLPASAARTMSGRPTLGDPDNAFLSGPATRPMVLRAVTQLCRALTIPVIGCGGISDRSDALAYFEAGAAAVQVGTAMLPDPSLPGRLGLSTR